MPTPAVSVDWAATYAEHRRAMRTTAAMAIGGRHKELLGKSADDVVGDVLAELMVKDLTHVTNLRSYLTSAVRNRVRDLQRRSRHERPEDLEFDALVGVDDVEGPVDDHELAQQAAHALEQLPERERYAIVERVMKCRPAQEVGPELCVKPQRVSQLVNAGLGRLRKLPAFTALLPSDHTVATVDDNGRRREGNDIMRDIDDQLDAIIDAQLRHLEGDGPAPDLAELTEEVRTEAIARIAVLETLWSQSVEEDSDPVAQRFGFDRPGETITIDGRKVAAIRKAAGIDLKELFVRMQTAGASINAGALYRVEQNHRARSTADRECAGCGPQHLAGADRARQPGRGRPRACLPRQPRLSSAH